MELNNLIIVEFIGPDSSRHFDESTTQLLELNEQACRELSRETLHGSRRRVRGVLHTE